MIRVVPLDVYDATLMGKFCQNLYTAFGVGTQLVQDVSPTQNHGSTLDAIRFLKEAPAVASYQDDKVLFLTPMKLQDRKLIGHALPTHGLAMSSSGKAIVSSACVKDFETGLKLVSRHAMHEVGHLWDLHHCLDPRCAMYPTWTPSYAAGESSFCNYCREKSESRIRLAKS